MPNMVVLRYFSCPARSMKDTTLDDLLTTSCQFEPWLDDTAAAVCAPPSAAPPPARPSLESTGFEADCALSTRPASSKPRCWSSEMEDVRPDSVSCLCLSTLSRAEPRPLSSAPPTSTPTRVDLPASTLPTTATRRFRWRCSEGGRRTSTSARTRVSFAPRPESRVCTRCAPAPSSSNVIAASRLTAASTAAASIGPISSRVSPCPSKSRACSTSRRAASVSLFGAPVTSLVRSTGTADGFDASAAAEPSTPPPALRVP
mmetsp:Transcript_3599/g.9340  ORF Transcript_3599/g.9340 Transcript_3599/m.9340 type:complete len:259 (+) Transcript_3599:1144-1920(+)